VRFLKRLQLAGIRVISVRSNWTDFDDLYALIRQAVVAHMSTTDSPYFVLTDPDCALDSAPGDVLHVYKYILEKMSLRGVGASIRWDDWPSQVKTIGYEAAFRHLVPQPVEYEGSNYFFLDAAVDTTFAMFKKYNELIRLAPTTIRMLPPLAVRHLDFYLLPNFMPDDYIFYLNRSKGANHMGHLGRPLARSLSWSSRTRSS